MERDVWPSKPRHVILNLVGNWFHLIAFLLATYFINNNWQVGNVVHAYVQISEEAWTLDFHFNLVSWVFSHGFSFALDDGFSCQTNYETATSCQKPVSSSNGRCSKRLFCGLCWGESEAAVCGSDILLEPSFVSGLVKSGWGRVWVRPSHGWSHHSLQNSQLHRTHFSLAGE